MLEQLKESATVDSGKGNLYNNNNEKEAGVRASVCAATGDGR